MTKPSRGLMENLNNAEGVRRMQEHKKTAIGVQGFVLCKMWWRWNAWSIWKLLSWCCHTPWGRACSITEVPYCTAVGGCKNWCWAHVITWTPVPPPPPPFFGGGRFCSSWARVWGSLCIDAICNHASNALHTLTRCDPEEINWVQTATQFPGVCLMMAQCTGLHNTQGL